ncbi:hypothetical protein CH63R_11436 [Colletotrichum higginsianum IMI 349063]|uniref:Uncharacterized protein n=1 Tax=Colletotrichum higginsianum (strain IMI 349063) TaxID=759273 RepID=A0A1B7XY75_COLHI|nr:hypothetical protein CH63R_11436 [Colletotrichum higginsianum IMI 349063]OBR04733.1 hypothetical protein CH63R_11436 [Colletotrichum higginsianum IMI 349063]
MGKSIICIVTGSSNSRENSNPPSFVPATPFSLSLSLSHTLPTILEFGPAKVLTTSTVSPHPPSCASTLSRSISFWSETLLHALDEADGLPIFYLVAGLDRAPGDGRLGDYGPTRHRLVRDEGPARDGFVGNDGPDDDVLVTGPEGSADGLLDVPDLKGRSVAVDEEQAGQGCAETDHVRVPAGADLEDLASSGGRRERGGCVSEGGGGVDPDALAREYVGEVQEDHGGCERRFGSIREGLQQGEVGLPEGVDLRGALL